MDNLDKENEKIDQPETIEPYKMQGDILNIGPGTLPDGLQLAKNDYGFCLIATKHFKKGEPVFKCECIFVPPNIEKFKFTLNGLQHICDSNHSIGYQNYRQLYRFMCFLNHSCQENNNSFLVDGQWVNIAVKDIQPGQQLKTNYLYFDYFGSLRFKCLCNTPSCVGEVKGFKNLTLEKKIELLPKAYWSINLWKKQDKSIIIVDDLKIPQTLAQKFEENKLKLYSKKQFKKGDELFKLKKQNNIMENKTIIYRTGETYQKWNSPEQFSYFVSLLPSNPDPNCKLIFQQNEILGICQKDIKKNDQICI